jgi:hypothetical protein
MHAVEWAVRPCPHAWGSNSLQRGLPNPRLRTTRAFLVNRWLLRATPSLGAGRSPTTDIPTTYVPFHFHWVVSWLVTLVRARAGIGLVCIVVVFCFA